MWGIKCVRVKITFPTDCTPRKTMTNNNTQAPIRQPTIFQFIPPPSSMLPVVSNVVRYLNTSEKSLCLSLMSYQNPGGVTNYHICWHGMCNFWGAFFEQKLNFGVSFLVKSQVVINYGVSF